MLVLFFIIFIYFFLFFFFYLFIFFKFIYFFIIEFHSLVLWCHYLFCLLWYFVVVDIIQLLKAILEYGGVAKRTDELFSVSAPRAMKKFFQGLKVSQRRRIHTWAPYSLAQRYSIHVSQGYMHIYSRESS